MKKLVKLYKLTESDAVVVDGQEYVQFYHRDKNVHKVRYQDEFIVTKEKINVLSTPIEKYRVNKIKQTKSGFYESESDIVYFALEPKIRDILGAEVKNVTKMVHKIEELVSEVKIKNTEIDRLKLSEKNAWDIANRYEHTYYSFNSMLWWQRLLFLFKIIKVSVD